MTTKNLPDQIDNALVANMQPFFDNNLAADSFSTNQILLMEKLGQEMGDIYAWFRMYGDFHSQVINNGLVGGYIGNGYHSTEGTDAVEMDIHNELIRRTKALLEDETLECVDELKLLVEILESVYVEIDDDYHTEETCHKCDGHGVTYDFNDDGDEIEEPCTCDNGTEQGFNSNYEMISFDCIHNLKDVERRYLDAEILDKILVAINNKLGLIKE